MSDGIIDLGEYLRRRDGEPEQASTFALWGAEGERSRFALPLWRAIYLARGERGGILRESQDGGALEPYVVLDLASEPARTDFHWEAWEGGDTDRVPELRFRPDVGLTVYLGAQEGRRWFLVVAEGGAGGQELGGRDREDVLFLSGECAGLLFLRNFADEVPPGSGTGGDGE